MKGRLYMFGYIKPFTPRLLVCEYDNYKAVYCGVCRDLQQYAPMLRLSLSYDFVFAALFRMCATGENELTKPFRCAVNPAKKRPLCQNEATKFSAAAAVVMSYYKLCDDIADGKRLRILFKPFFKRPLKRAERDYPGLRAIIAEGFENQLRVEKDPDSGIDLAADPTAAALGKLLESCEQNPAGKRSVYEFGYMLGRWVYLIDAADDLKKDQKSGGFNPFKACPERRIEVLNLCVTEVSARYDKLPSQYHHPVIDNIIELGTLKVQNDIMSPDTGKIKKQNDRHNFHKTN